MTSVEDTITISMKEYNELKKTYVFYERVKTRSRKRHEKLKYDKLMKKKDEGGELKKIEVFWIQQYLEENKEENKGPEGLNEEEENEED